MIWSAVRSVASHVHLEKSARLFLRIDEQKRPTSELKRLILTRDALDKPIAKGLVLTLIGDAVVIL